MRRAGAVTTSDISVERRGSALWITFDRPQVRNALTFEMYDTLVAACRGANDDPSIRAVVITGGERAFAAGTDIGQFSGVTSDEQYLDYEHRADEIMDAIESVEVPTIAAIGGACTGGGAGIAAACDLRIATSTIRYGIPIARTLGNCVSLRAYTRIAVHLGPSRAARVFLAAELLGADELRAAGFVLDVVGEGRLEARAEELAGTVAHLAPLTIRASKTVLREVRNQAVPSFDDTELILSCYRSRDFREGGEAFLAKRRPNFTGR
jgi:enoyl-CoA hydratase